MTGVRRAPIDRRRVRGEHRGLKTLLVEGFNGGSEHAQPWKDFSGAMIRQSVDEAVNSLPAQHKQVVKLAYFGGLSNGEIARELDMPVGGVRRRLREALATVSAYVERGQTAGRRAVYAVAGWLTARSIVEQAQRSSGTNHLFQAAMAVTVGVAAAAVLVAGPASPVQHRQIRGGGVHVAAPAGSASVRVAKPVAPAGNLPLPTVSPALPAAPGVPSLPVPPGLRLRLPVSVTVPAITVPPIPKHWI